MLRTTLLILALVLLVRAQAQLDPFFVTVSGGDLYKVHLQPCSTAFVGSTGQGFGDIALAPDGNLYGIAGGTIYRVDTANGNATYIGQSTAPGVAMEALSNATLLVEYAEDLYAVSTADASTSLIGHIGYGALGDLTWYGGQLYMSTGGQLVRIDSEDGFASILSVTPVGTFDPDMPVCEGLATTLIADGHSSIVGFAYPDLICFSPFNGTYSTICQLDLPGGVPGAAAPFLPAMPASGCGGIGTGMDTRPPSGHLEVRVTDDRLHVRPPAGLLAEACFVRDPSGKVVRQAPFTGAEPLSLSLAGLASGAYLVEIVHGDLRSVERFAYIDP